MIWLERALSRTQAQAQAVDKLEQLCSRLAQRNQRKKGSLLAKILASCGDA